VAEPSHLAHDRFGRSDRGGAGCQDVVDRASDRIVERTDTLDDLVAAGFNPNVIRGW
jgi:hypothetical protein